MNVMGIDPGMTGAIAVIGDSRQEVYDMPVGSVQIGKTARNRIIPELLARLIRDLMPVDVCYIEEVSSMPNQGISGAFAFGQSHGLVLGAVATTGTRIVRLRPQMWQRAIKATKDPRVRALELYPSFAGELKRAKDEGRADAILIARAGIELEKQ